MQADVKAYVKVCDKCQCYSNIPRQPPEYLTPNSGPLALCSVGVGHLQSFSYGDEKNEVLGGRDWLFYQIDKSRAIGKNNQAEHQKLCLEKHYLSLRNP